MFFTLAFDRKLKIFDRKLKWAIPQLYTKLKQQDIFMGKNVLFIKKCYILKGNEHMFQCHN